MPTRISDSIENRKTKRRLPLVVMSAVLLTGMAEAKIDASPQETAAAASWRFGGVSNLPPPPPPPPLASRGENSLAPTTALKIKGGGGAAVSTREKKRKHEPSLLTRTVGARKLLPPHEQRQSVHSFSSFAPSSSTVESSTQRGWNLRDHNDMANGQTGEYLSNEGGSHAHHDSTQGTARPQHYYQGEESGSRTISSPTNTNAVAKSDGNAGDTKTPNKYGGFTVEAIACMSLLALQFGFQPMLVRRYTPSNINRSTIVLVQEIVKFMIAFGAYFGGTQKEHREKELSGWSIKTWITIAGIPAALYTVQNVASLLAYQNLEALTFNVLNQTKILSAALCCYYVLGTKQSRMQLVSLVLLVTSALVMERVVTLRTLVLPFFGGSDGGSTGLLSTISKVATSFRGSMELTKRVTHGVLPVLFASLVSGLAGALTQKNLQGSGSSGSDKKKATPRNAYLFSMEMNAASALVLAASLLFSSDGKRIAELGFFDQWTPQTLIPVVTNALGGIIVALVTKHAGSVRKGFALIFGMVLSGIIQAGSAGGMTNEQILGGVLAAVSLWLHTSHSYKPRR